MTNRQKSRKILKKFVTKHLWLKLNNRRSDFSKIQFSRNDNNEFSNQKLASYNFFENYFMKIRRFFYGKISFFYGKKCHAFSGPWAGLGPGPRPSLLAGRSFYSFGECSIVLCALVSKNGEIHSK